MDRLQIISFCFENSFHSSKFYFSSSGNSTGKVFKLLNSKESKLTSVNTSRAYWLRHVCLFCNSPIQIFWGKTFHWPVGSRNAIVRNGSIGSGLVGAAEYVRDDQLGGNPRVALTGDRDNWLLRGAGVSFPGGLQQHTVRIYFLGAFKDPQHPTLYT